MEKKCENCVFCANKPEALSFLPNDWICGNYKSKWFSYWPPTGVCEMHTEPTGKTVAEVVGDRGMQAYEGLKMMLNAVWGNNAADEYIDKSTDLTRFDFCPECGKKIDWEQIKNG